MPLTSTDARPLLPGRPVLLVSPHLDDVILSCEAFIGCGEPVDVVTIFTGRPDPVVRTEWDVSTGFADSDAALDARLAEDEAAFAGTPHTRHGLGLLDGQYAGTFGVGAAGARPVADAARLVDWVQAWVERTGGVVVVPVGAGSLEPSAAARRPLPLRALGKARRVARRGLGLLRPAAPEDAATADRDGREPGESVYGPHRSPDHVWVSDVLVAHLRRQGREFGLYEEVPYRYGAPGDARIRALFGCAPVRLAEVDIDRAAKARRVGAYVSQLPYLITKARPLHEPAGLPATERYWFVPA